MEGEIVNRVANSKLVTLDLEDFYPEGPRYGLDISQWLFEGLVLREKEFRAQVQAHDWSMYQDGYLYLYCSSDAIIPIWAYMLCSTEAANYSKKVVIGNESLLENILFSELIQGLDLTEYQDKPVVIKGCTNKPVPDAAYSLLSQKLHGIAKSIMFGEACSSVPLYKRK